MSTLLVFYLNVIVAGGNATMFAKYKKPLSLGWTVVCGLVAIQSGVRLSLEVTQ